MLARKILSVIIIVLFLITALGSMTTSEENNSRSNPPTLNYSTPGLANNTWPKFRGDPAGTGNTTATGPDYYYELWKVSTAALWGSPVVLYDQIYTIYRPPPITSLPGATNCYNLSGGLQWTFNVGNQYGSPLVHDGRVYIVGYNGNLYCLDANATGSGTTTNYWTYSPSGVRDGASSPVTDGEKVYYSAKHASGLHAVWINNGTKAWNASLGGSTDTESSPSYWNGRVYCGGGNSYDSGTNDLYCFNATDGSLIWNFKTGDDVVSTPAIAYGRVYFGSMDYKIYCVDAIGSNGSTTKYWDYNTSAATLGIYSSASVAYDRVYIGATNSRLYCLDAHGNGSTTLYWNQIINPSGNWGLTGSAAITPEYVFIGNSNNAIHCRNRTTGAEVWSQTLSPSATYGLGSPLVYKDTLFVTSDNSYLYALSFDRTPPKVESTWPTPGTDDVEMHQNISVQFDEEIDGTTVTTTNFVLKDSSDVSVAGSLSTAMGTKTVYFDPDDHLEKDETYTFTIKTEIKDIHENYLDGNGNGIAEGAGVDEYVFNFTTIPFYSPRINDIPKLKPTEDIPYSRNLSGYIFDSDTPKQELILTQNSSYGTLKGYELHLLYPEGVTSDLINISVSDGMFSAYREIQVEVKPVNDLPVIGSISPLELTEDITYSLDMSDHIVDIDTPFSELLLYVFSKNYDAKLGYYERDNFLINFTYPNGITFDVINVTVFEGDYNGEQKDSTEIEISITPVNDKPILNKPLTEIRLDEDTTDESIRLSTWFSDIDDETLDYSSTGSKNIIVIVDSSGGVILEPKENWYGEEDVTFTATDSGSEEVSTVLKVIVVPVNDEPKIIKLVSPEDDDIIEFNTSIELKVLVQDEDLKYGDTLSFYWSSSEDGGIGYTQNVSDVILTPGDHIITITVTDENSTEVMESITVTVKADPNPPKTDPKPDDNNTKPSDGDGEEEDNGDSSSESSGFGGMMTIIIIIIVVVVVLILMAFLFMKRKKKDEETETTSAGEGQSIYPEIAAQQQQMQMQMQMKMQQQQQQQQTPQQIQPMQPPPMQQVPVQEHPQTQQHEYQLSEQDKLLFEQTQYPDQGPQIYDQTLVTSAPEQLESTQEDQQSLPAYSGSDEKNLTEEQTQNQDSLSDDDPLSNAKNFSLPDPEE